LPGLSLTYNTDQDDALVVCTLNTKYFPQGSGSTYYMRLRFHLNGTPINPNGYGDYFTDDSASFRNHHASLTRSMVIPTAGTNTVTVFYSTNASQIVFSEALVECLVY
jgi:hypothetical protein